MALFTVIVPTYDRPDMLQTALESVRAQTVDDLECIVVEDAPPKPSARLPVDDPRFRVIRHSTNRGVAAARNTGIAHATGQFITFLDDDDKYVPDRLECVLPLLDEAHVVVCARGHLEDGSKAHFRPLQGDVHDVIADEFTPHLGQTTIPREACPGFDERYVACQDIEWWLRVSRRLPVRSTAHVGYLMRRHDGARHGNGKSARARCSLMLLSEYPEYFDAHPKAKAFRLERLARLQRDLGQRPAALGSAMSSLRARPNPRSIALALRLVLSR